MQKWKRQLFSPKLAEGSDKDTFWISFRNGFLFLKKQFITFSVGADDTIADVKRKEGEWEGGGRRRGRGRERDRKVTSVDRLVIKTIGHMTCQPEKQSVISDFNASMTDDRRRT